jgi:ATP-dependent DNA helicase RecG
MLEKELLEIISQGEGVGIEFKNNDISPVIQTSKNDLDNQKYIEYYNLYYNLNIENMTENEVSNLLLNADILVEFENKNVASVGGLLIFGKNPQRYLPQSSIVFAVYNGIEITDELIDKKEITGTLQNLIDTATDKILMYLPSPSKINGIKREEKIIVPRIVLREAIVNAVVHRDYSIYNEKIKIFIFKNRIEIISPGRLGNTLTIEKIKVGNSAPRNHFLLKYLDNMRYIDGLGRGIPMMFKEMLNYGEILIKELGSQIKVELIFQ